MRTVTDLDRADRRLHFARSAALRALCVGVACISASPTQAPAATAPLRLQVNEGRNLNVLVRDGASAAHLVLRNGTDPRLLVAFPAGNSGVGAWFARTSAPVNWRLVGPVAPVTMKDAQGRPLRGIAAEVEVNAPTLAMGRVVVGSVRVLRDYEALHTVPPDLNAAPRREGAALVWARPRLDAKAGYFLSVAPLNGDLTEGAHPVWRSRGGALRLRIVAATGDPPLTPIAEGEALTAAAGSDPRARASLAFLSYREKLLAGSWRFLTYFGRDTLMSVRLLLPVLRPEEAEAGLGAVLERLSPTGEVAHEESIGEFAVMENLKAGRGRVDTPVYDYKMIDGDYMLAPVLQAYAQRYGPARLHAFLQRRAPDGTPYADLLARNLRHVVATTRPFAATPSADTLIHLKPGVPVGEWRDSDTGLAGGRTPYDVNAVLVPASLDATAALVRDAGLAGASGAPSAAEAARLAQAWKVRAPGYFDMRLPPGEAREAVGRFAREQGVDAAPALASLPATALRFAALSLDAGGRPVAVLNSDVGFALLFGRPAPEALARMVSSVMRPFPAGLMTDVGPVVADAAYAPAEVRRAFGRTAYHGAVVWAWQEAVLIAGIDRQLARGDLPGPLKSQLGQARTRLCAAVRAVGETRTSELWSWAYAGGRYRVQAFGAAAGDADESNAAQLWSTVLLALDRSPAAE